MTYEPKHLKRWTLPENYYGAIWPAYFSSGVTQSGESDALERSNFTCMLTALDGETDTVILVHESHWAVGWIEWIAIHQDDEKALAIADEIRRKLDDNPVVNEEYLFKVNQEDADLAWRDGFRVEDRVAYIRQHRQHFDFGGFVDLLGCVRGSYFKGHASELLRDHGGP